MNASTIEKYVSIDSQKETTISIINSIFVRILIIHKLTIIRFNRHLEWRTFSQNSDILRFEENKAFARLHKILRHICYIEGEDNNFIEYLIIKYKLNRPELIEESRLLSREWLKIFEDNFGFNTFRIMRCSIEMTDKVMIDFKEKMSQTYEFHVLCICEDFRKRCETEGWTYRELYDFGGVLQDVFKESIHEIKTNPDSFIYNFD